MPTVLPSASRFSPFFSWALVDRFTDVTWRENHANTCLWYSFLYGLISLLSLFIVPG
uniref:Uncharacterized protein n=1 Tax=Rhizophora mucronata TaxID=61149 RepID=A0A2P2Q542_RHIMU